MTCLLKAGHSLCPALCPQAEVQPQCGRAVGFSSGTENPHGVKAVSRGQRCAIALWFTLDARHSERVRAAGAAGTWEGPCSASARPPPQLPCRWLRRGRHSGLGGPGVRRRLLSALRRCGHCRVTPGLPPDYNGAPRAGGKVGNDPGSWFLIVHLLSWLCPESRTCWEGDELGGC